MTTGETKVLTLGEQLSQTSSSIVELIIATSDLNEATQLKAELDKIHNETARLVDSNVDKSTDDYAAATKVLEETNAAIKEAIEDLKKTAETIKKIAVVVQVLAKVAKTAAG